MMQIFTGKRVPDSSAAIVEIEPMKAEIEALAKKAAEAERAGDAMQFAQAALNVAHALATLNNVKSGK